MCAHNKGDTGPETTEEYRMRMNKSREIDSGKERVSKNEREMGRRETNDGKK